MKKFLIAMALGAAVALQACWIDPWDVHLQIVKVNEAAVPGDEGYPPQTSLPCGIRLIQQGFDSSYPAPVIAKLQYAVYRQMGDEYVKIIPITTVAVLGNGTNTLPLTGNTAKQYFGTIKIRPDRSIVRSGDYILIRVWVSNALIANAMEFADINFAVYMLWYGGLMEDDNLGGGWTIKCMACVQFNGKWGAR